MPIRHTQTLACTHVDAHTHTYTDSWPDTQLSKGVLFLSDSKHAVGGDNAAQQSGKQWKRIG